MTYPAVLFLALIGWSFFWPKERMLYLLFGSFAFGSLALVPPNLVSGFNLLPGQAVCFAMLARQCFDARGLDRMARAAVSIQDSALLILFWIWSAVSALTFASLFQGQIIVLAMRGGLTLLAPSPQNFTTMAYVTMSVMLLIVLQSWMSEKDISRTLLKAMIFGGAILALTGVLDVALGAGQKAYFAPFKTAQYAFMDGSQVLGLRRVQGLMTEASAYGPTCIGFASFLILAGNAFRPGLERISALVVGWLLIVMAAMSTSSAAFVGLAVFFVLFIANLGWRFLSKHPSKDPMLPWDFSLVIATIVGLAVVYLITPEAFSVPASFIDAIIFKKSQSDSYADRMSWNAVALNAFAATNGLGVGVGSTRASNWALAVLSNTGFVGASLMVCFYVLQFLKPPKRPTDASLVRASKFTTIAILSTLVLVGTSPDFGLFQAALFAIIIAHTAQLGWRSPIRQKWTTQQAYGIGGARRVQ